MALPWLIAGAVIGVVADELLSDDKPELKTSTDRKQISASDVPADIRAQIEGREKKFTNLDFAQMLYDEANDCYYNQRNIERAFNLYKQAADKGLWKAKNQLKTLYNYNY